MIQQLISELTEDVKNLHPSERYFLGLTGCPGAGKSTMANQIVTGINEFFGDERAIVVPMDGFHLANEILRDRQILHLKGIPESFDAAGFVSLLAELKAVTDKTVFAPLFDRENEVSIAKAIRVEPKHRICLVEGNYLLLQEEPWRQARSFLDQVWFVDVPIASLIPRLQSRREAAGDTPSEALKRVEVTDLPNARLIQSTRELADRLLKM